jgi:hypothetical protein
LFSVIATLMGLAAVVAFGVSSVMIFMAGWSHAGADIRLVWLSSGSLLLGLVMGIGAAAEESI